MKITETGFHGLVLIDLKKYNDERGHFSETYRKDILEEAGFHHDFVQSNESFSKKGVLRGLHMQNEPHAQAKLVRVVQGSILDIVVDYRLNSSTFGQHFKINLSNKSNNMLLVPKGFLHGFLALEDVIFNYMVDNYYNGPSEAGVLWNDSTLNIDWGINNPIVSEKDQELPSFNEFIKSFNQ